MNLSLEETVVLVNTPEWSERKSKIIEESMEMLPNLEWGDVNRIMECLVVRNLIERKAGVYKMRPEGLVALKENHSAITGLLNKIGALTSLR